MRAHSAFWLALAIGSMFLAPPTLGAESLQMMSKEDSALLEAARHISVNDTATMFQQRELYTFRRANVDGKGISAAGYELRKRISQAAMRAQLIMPWLNQDLDGDGKVTRSELETFFTPQAGRTLQSGNGVELTPTADQIAEIRKQLVDKALTADQNHDGIITFDEINAAALKDSRASTAVTYLEHPEVPLLFDANHDGVVSEAEFIQPLQAVFRTADQNGDGTISATELETLRKRAEPIKEAADQERRAAIERASLEQVASSCPMPKVSNGTQLILLSMSSGSAMSTVSLGGDDRQISVSDVAIEPGSGMLALVLLSANGQIWRFSGAIQRVASVWVSAGVADSTGVPRVGVVGIDKNKVAFPQRTDCVQPFFEAESKQASMAIDAIKTLVGRAPDLTLAKPEISQITLPAKRFDEIRLPGAVDLKNEEPSGHIWQELSRIEPSGVIKIEERSVIAPTKVKSFDVLPHYAGLAQLVERGALDVVGTEQIIEVGTMRVVGSANIVVPENMQPHISIVPSKFLIKQKITLPAELSRVTSLKLVLAPNTPEPDGDLKTVEIIRQEPN